MIIYLAWFGAIVLAIVFYLREAYSKFSRYGVSNIKPVPFVGNIGPLMMRKKHITQDFQDLYNAFPRDRFVGRYEIVTPSIMIRDLDLIKKVTVKDFEHFLDHKSIVDSEADPMFGRNLFQLKGQEWKDMRATLSPAFTSSKIRNMVPFMKDVNNQMFGMLNRKIKESKTGYIDIDCKDIMTRYANDVIATCAFGVKVDSHNETDNDFYLHGKSISQFDLRRILIYLGYATFPTLMKKMNFKLFGGEAERFLKSLFFNALMDRETKNIFRPDMIHLLMQVKKGKLLHDDVTPNDDAGFATVEESDVGKKDVTRSWSDDDLVAQAFLFFLAGFETVSTTMSFLMHELALHPDVQERLLKEIREHDAKNKGNVDYASIQSMKYLDMVISELLRMWPPAVALDRICIKDYNLGRPRDGATRDYVLRKGESISIPVWPIHRDPQFYENPNKFDPERFSDENKHKIKPFSYLPFGSGPRNCIGSRFALCEVKMMIYQYLLQFEVLPCEKTVTPVKINPKYFTLSIDGGNWVRMKPRQKVAA